MPRPVLCIALAAATALAGCARPGVPAPLPAPKLAPIKSDTARRRPPRVATPQNAEPPGLPPIPFVAGSLAVHVVYPAYRQLITSSDSTFVLGSVGNGNATLTIDGQPATVYANGSFMAFVANPPASFPQYDLVAVLGADTVRATHEVRVRVRSPASQPTAPVEPDTTGKWVMLSDPGSTLSDTDAAIVARPLPGETYHWFFLPGTVVWRDRSIGGSTRIKLDQGLSVWVPDSLTHDMPASTTAPRRITENATVVSAAGWEDFVLPVGRRPAYFVEERDHAIDLTLYDTRGNTDIIYYPTSDSLIRRVEWAQVADDRVRFTLHLNENPYGYLVLWDNGRFVLRVRRAPVVDSARPLRGQVIAVDPGHPPAGATGPTGLYEGDAVLAVAIRLKAMLEADGATVVMTRSTLGAVGLADRPVTARRADADVFVSIHLNAFPDGVNPFTAPEGTATFFYRGQSEPLARAVQEGVVGALGLPDQGVVFRSLSVVRQTWMPSVLCEGAFVIVPRQEAALRTAAFQDAYARGIANGLRDYFRALGRAQ